MGSSKGRICFYLVRTTMNMLIMSICRRGIDIVVRAFVRKLYVLYTNIRSQLPKDIKLLLP